MTQPTTPIGLDPPHPVQGPRDYARLRRRGWFFYGACVLGPAIAGALFRAPALVAMSAAFGLGIPVLHAIRDDARYRRILRQGARLDSDGRGQRQRLGRDLLGARLLVALGRYEEAIALHRELFSWRYRLPSPPWWTSSTLGVVRLSREFEFDLAAALGETGRARELAHEIALLYSAYPPGDLGWSAYWSRVARALATEDRELAGREAARVVSDERFTRHHPLVLLALRDADVASDDVALTRALRAELDARLPGRA